MDTVNPVQFIFASFFVLGLLGLMAVVLKYYSQKSLGKSPFASKLFAGQSQGRIAILETQHIDHKSKLLLVKRDDVEHLLLLGDGKALIIESGIKQDA